ncbi:MAG TPA: hypothetical protein VFC76_08715 [Oscillospiraceae bacterium]|nr:hypothetical protein [Oscillospiraceae bacterium]
MSRARKNDLRYDFLRSCLTAAFPMVAATAILIIQLCMPLINSLIVNRFDYNLLFTADLFIDEIVYALLLILGMGMAFLQFSFLGSKSKSNVVMSFGISRYSLFINRVISSVAAIFIAVFIPLTIILIENGKYIGIQDYTIKTYMLFVFSFFTIALIGFVVFTLANLLVSTSIEAMLLGISLLTFPYIIINFFSLCFKTLLTGYSFRFMPFFRNPINTLYWLSPINLIRTKTDIWGPVTMSSVWYDKGIINSSLFTENVKYAKEAVSYPLSIYMPFAFWSLLCIFMLFAAYRIFKKRKMEVNGMYKSSYFSAGFISLAAILLVAVLSFSSGSFLPFLPGQSFYLAALITSALVISIFCLFLFFSKHKRRHAIALLSAFLIIIFATAFSCTLGGFGFSSRIPSFENIDNIAVSLPYKIDTSDIANLDVLSGFETDKEKEQIINIHKMLIENNNDDASQKDFFITYYLKNGTKLIREYANVSFEALSEITKLYDCKTVKDYVYSQLVDKAFWSTDENPEYYWAKSASFNLTDKTPLHFDNVNVTLRAADSLLKTDITEKLTKESFDTLIKTIAQDTKLLSSKEFYTPKKPPIGIITLSDNTINKNEYNGFIHTIQSDYNFYIYPSMEKTTAYLSSLGVYNAFNKKSEIVKIELSDCENKDYYIQIHRSLLRYQSFDFKTRSRYFSNHRYLSSGDMGFDITKPYKTLTKKDDIELIREKLYPNYLAVNEKVSIAVVTYTDGVAVFIVKD